MAKLKEKKLGAGEEEVLENDGGAEGETNQDSTASVDNTGYKSEIVVDNGEERIVTTLPDGTVVKSVL